MNVETKKFGPGDRQRNPDGWKTAKPALMFARHDVAEIVAGPLAGKRGAIVLRHGAANPICTLSLSEPVQLPGAEFKTHTVTGRESGLRIVRRADTQYASFPDTFDPPGIHWENPGLSKAVADDTP